MGAVRFGAYWGDPLLVERVLSRALAGMGAVRRVVLFGDEPCLARLLGELGSVDLFGERRAIVVRRADKLMEEERLARTLANGLPTDLALFVLGEALKGPVVQMAEEALALPTPTGRALRALASELLAEAELPRSASLVDCLVEAAGGDTLRLAQEVGKLTVWKGERLPPDRLPEILYFSGGAPYAYLDAVGSKDFPPALSELRMLLDAGWSPSALFFALVGHVRSLLAALAAQNGGRDPSGPAWLVRKRLAQARAWGEARLIGRLASLQNLDLQIKTGQLSAEAALYHFTFGLAQFEQG
ncbi:MAG: DNA polymerase III subunit delta [Candidatus Bipolaricaulota bacterium]